MIVMPASITGMTAHPNSSREFVFTPHRPGDEVNRPTCNSAINLTRLHFVAFLPGSTPARLTEALRDLGKRVSASIARTFEVTE
jgi:hypothetical protein